MRGRITGESILDVFILFPLQYTGTPRGHYGDSEENLDACVRDSCGDVEILAELAGFIRASDVLLDVVNRSLEILPRPPLTWCEQIQSKDA